jgi:hypothetical protein
MNTFAARRATRSGDRPGSLAMKNAHEERKPATLARPLRSLLLFCAAPLLLCAAPPALHATEVDLSCMSQTVLGKIQVAERYKEYDVVLNNNCPGPVYWTMCIERVDPLSHKVVEVHTPSGYLEAEQKSRVNLHMKKGPERMAFRKRFQEFYVSAGYAIDAAAVARCVAGGCEAERRDIRTRFDANTKAWEQAEAALSARLASECPQSGWGKTEQVETCEAGIREAAREELERLTQSDAELRKELQVGGPEHCRLYGGDLVP